MIARKGHGRCGGCPNLIKAGDEYVRATRHATKDERDDPRVKTFSVRGRGPQVAIKYHMSCQPNKRAQ